MHIGLVGQKLLIKNPAGVEKYIYHLFNGLAKVDKENSYTIYVTEIPKKDFWEELTHNNPNFKYKVINYSKTPFVSWTQMLLAKELKKNPPDVVFYPTDTISGFLNWTTPKRFKPICMIHDLGYVKTKEYRNTLVRLLHYSTLFYVLIFSKKLVVPSKEVRENVIRAYPSLGNILYKKNKVVVISEGLNENFHNSNKITNRDIEKTREKYGLDNKPYLYFVSTIQPRKNIPLMVAAFSDVIKNNPRYKDLLLVLSGKKGWHYQESLNSPKKYGVKENVKFIGRTTDEEIPILMKGAKAFINVSLEEGFGLPLLEAMACETPPIVSNIKVYKELAKENAIYVNPKNRESIKNGILHMLSGICSAKCLKGAKKMADEYTWEKSAEKILSVFKNI